MSNLNKLTLEEWEYRTDAALHFIRQSIKATGGKGSAHSWHPLFGWSKAYPETTGYLIETLLDYAERKQDESLHALAFSCVNWLETIQLPSGAFTGLLAGNTKPSVFNTSQILFGLKARKMASEKAVSWLLSNLDSDGAWRAHAFVSGFVPSYYTRAVWGVLQTNDSPKKPEVEVLMLRSLHFYAERFLPNGAVRDWGFRAGEAAFTHTLAYTLEGFWESAKRLGEQTIMDKTIAAVERLLAERARAGGRTAGRYDEAWNGDYSFLCNTGNCQLSILCHKLWEHTGEPKFRDAASSFLSEIIGFQKLVANKNSFGALPGSAPFWGAYLPFRYPNWAAKFFLDAVSRNAVPGQF
ncbi:MAG: hypothetical protein ACKVU0_03940 [Saprospiraceae bacterium]